MRGQVGDVRNPHLFRAAGNDLLRAGLEQVGMAAKAVMAMGGLVIGPFARN
ncbi:hypothetical protein D3C86_2165580 [compost metagenome]